MMVFELIAKLQELPPTMQVMIDHTTEHMDMFKFAGINSALEVGTSLNEQIVLISHQEFEDEEDED